MKYDISQARRLGIEQYAVWLCQVNGVGYSEDIPTVDVSQVHNWVRQQLSPEENVSVEPPVEIPVVGVAESVFPEDLGYNAMTVVELRALCKERDLPVYGTKAEIVLRLKQHDEGLVASEDEAEGPAEAAPEVESEAPAEEVAASVGDELNDSGEGQEPVFEEE